MSDRDSFIEEVNEELQRDKLFGLFRKYGWIAGLLVFLIVGGAAYNEWRKATDTSAARAMGDNILSALTKSDPNSRATALGQVAPDNETTKRVLEMLQAAELLQANDKDAALALLDGVIASPDLAQVYRDLARLKAVLLRGADLDQESRVAIFDQLATPGNPFRVIAMEQKALVLIEYGNKDDAIALYLQILDEPGVTQALLQRAQQVIVALGGELPETADTVGIDG